eukprot:jgi/Mesen1/7961/ME000422S07121
MAVAVAMWMGMMTWQVTCEWCLRRELEGGRRVSRMLPCQRCHRSFHRACIKAWGSHRDKFDWSNWVCGACRPCEICRRTGDASKVMCCKKCDKAYHTYCVYRDTEKAPMVCCDADETYQRYQSDENLPYKCPPCRGQGHQVSGPEDAVGELWRRKEAKDLEKLTAARVAAGLPAEATPEPARAPPPSDDETDDEDVPLAVHVPKVVLKKKKGRRPKVREEGEGGAGAGAGAGAAVEREKGGSKQEEGRGWE